MVQLIHVLIAFLKNVIITFLDTVAASKRECHINLFYDMKNTV